MRSVIIFLSCSFLMLQAYAQQLSDEIAAFEKDRQVEMQNYDSRSVSSNNFDVTYYRCDWTVNPSVRFISGSVTSYFTISITTNNIVYDLAFNLTVDSVVYHGARISFLQSANNSLQINFPSQLNQNQKDSVSIFYKGAPTAAGGYFVVSSHAGTPVLWTLSEPYGASIWWPCKDVLKDKADSIDIIVSCPSAYRSSSNGLPVSETIVGPNRIAYWKHRYPIAAYLVAIAVTNYLITNDAIQLSRNMPVVTYTYPEAGTTFQAAINTSKFCLQNFSPLITEYPFVNERYAQTQFGYGGGMEHQTNSFITNANAYLVAHELAHQWFGDKVTCGSWSDIWLNEGCASYMEFVYTELSNPSAKISFLQNWANNITITPGGSVFVADTLNVGRVFDGRLTYRKGGYLLHMLRGVLGDSVFFRGIRRYLNDPLLRYNTATTTDLQRNLEAESGKNLSEFFNDWFYGQGYPDYHANWGQLPGNVVRLQLYQTPVHPSVSFFEMPVRLQFKNASRDTTIIVQHTINGQLFTLNPGFAADQLIIDPDLWILSKVKTTTKLATVKGDNKLLVYPNPSSDNVNISLPAVVNSGVVELFNSAGQKAYAAKLPASALEYSLNVSKFAAGVYWLKISGDGFKQATRILVSHR
ncbi:MAG: peptidase M1 [Chitinophagaceae bacterium]